MVKAFTLFTALNAPGKNKSACGVSEVRYGTLSMECYGKSFVCGQMEGLLYIWKDFLQVKIAMG